MVSNVGVRGGEGAARSAGEAGRRCASAERVAPRTAFAAEGSAIACGSSGEALGTIRLS